MERILYKNIIATITYYDVLDYPLTAFEIWRHLIRSPYDHTMTTWALSDIYGALSSDVIADYVSEKNGFFFLSGRDQLVEKRRRREVISKKKMKRLERIVRILRWSPYVRMICVTGRLAYRNCDKRSDLDLLVAYEPGHIWTGRFFLTLFAHVIGVRRYGTHVSDRVCLNYHITTETMTVPTKDLFAAHEYSFIIPVFGREFFARFVEGNMWIKEYKPHYMYDEHVWKHFQPGMGKNDLMIFVKRVLEWIVGDVGMEKRLRNMQYKKIMQNPKTRENGALILCSDHHLVFLPKPHGPSVFEEYKKRYEALELSF